MKFANLQQFIKDQGWSFYGIVDTKTVKTALNKHKIIFDRWISHGFQADMNYLERMKDDRFFPENKLSDVKSFIVLGAMYSNRFRMGSELNSNRGNIARYARGKDYHKVLKKRLVLLAHFLKTH